MEHVEILAVEDAAAANDLTGEGYLGDRRAEPAQDTANALLDRREAGAGSGEVAKNEVVLHDLERVETHPEAEDPLPGGLEHPRGNSPRGVKMHGHFPPYPVGLTSPRLRRPSRALAGRAPGARYQD